MSDTTRRMALCSMSAALSLVIMLLGSATGVFTYASPMLAGLILLPAGRRYGIKWHLIMWFAAGALSAMLVSDIEETLIFVCIAGWYPAVRPAFERFRKVPRILLKLLLFNMIIIPLEELITRVLVPEAETLPMKLLALVLGNVLFIMYDLIIPKAEAFFKKRLSKLFR